MSIRKFRKIVFWGPRETDMPQSRSNFISELHAARKLQQILNQSMYWHEQCWHVSFVYSYWFLISRCLANDSIYYPPKSQQKTTRRGNP